MWYNNPVGFKDVETKRCHGDMAEKRRNNNAVKAYLGNGQF